MHRIFDTKNTVSKVYTERYAERLQLSERIMNITALLNTEHEIIIMDANKHGVFIYKEEVQALLELKLRKTKNRLEMVSAQLNRIEQSGKEVTA